MELTFKIIEQANITKTEGKFFGDLLKIQNKVKPDKNGSFDKKASRCLFICIVYNNDKPIAIGGIKKVIDKHFSMEYANVPEKSKLFENELGYIFTLAEFRGNNIAGRMVDIIIKKFGNKNLVSSTELNEKNNMQKILDKRGFKNYGKSWKSKDNNDLGLFLKFA